MIETLIVIIGTILTLAIGLFVFARDPKQRVNQIYTLMTLAFVALMVANSFTTSNPTQRSLIFIRIVLAATTLAVPAVYFLIHFISNNRASAFKIVLHRIILVATVIIAILDLSPFVFSGIVIKNSTITPVPAFGAILFILQFITMIAITLVVLFRNFSKSRGSKRTQYASMIIGLAPVLLLAPITSFVLPVILHYSGLIFLSPIYTTFFVSMVAYAMVRHRLFDIKLAAVRTAAYILALATLSLIYYLVAFLVSGLLIRNNAPSLTISPLSIILALALAFIFQPIKHFFDRVTNFLFYRDSYSTEEFFARLTRKLSTMTDLMTLLTYASSEISKTLKASFGEFLVYRPEAQNVYAGGIHRWNMPKEDLAELDAFVHVTGDKVILAKYLDDAKDRHVKRMLLSHRIALVLPVMQKDLITGYLFLGEHLSAQYTARDVRALETIADELMIAIQNALSVQEVRDINATLQHRIDAATKELRATNAQLHKLDEAKDEFMSMASHQLRTPLTSVKGYISMVLEGDGGRVTPSQKKLLGEAFGSSERMVHLINDFLNVSRLQTGKFVIDKSIVNLPVIVKEELDSLSSTAAARGITFEYKMPKKFPAQLSIDEGKIRQVIMNYSDNAIFYSKENSKIKVELEATNKDIFFTVKDTGIGVPIEEQAHLFTKFFRAENARKARPDGTGVGLFLAKKVMNAHGGDVIFESKVGKGSTFGFRLPLSQLTPVNNVD